MHKHTIALYHLAGTRCSKSAHLKSAHLIWPLERTRSTDEAMLLSIAVFTREVKTNDLSYLRMPSRKAGKGQLALATVMIPGLGS